MLWSIIFLFYRSQLSSSVSAIRSQSPVDTMQPKSRSMSPVVKKPRKAMYMWGPNGTFDHL